MGRKGLSMGRFEDRVNRACKSLYTRSGIHECGTDSELVGIVQLDNGQSGQFHVTLTFNEDDFLDVDEPTGCGDDLIITPKDFE